jgi:hypothetical protein
MIRRFLSRESGASPAIGCRLVILIQKAILLDIFLVLTFSHRAISSIDRVVAKEQSNYIANVSHDATG